MCGIIGYVGPQGTDVTTILLEGLRKLEYRGYDSAGIAVLTSTGHLDVRRRAGKIANLEATIEDDARSQTAKPTGFLMDNTTSGALALAAERAVHVWKDPKRWRTIQLNGMAKDFGWETAARQYRDIYRKLGSG